MRILIDTNILILREDNKEVNEKLTELFLLFSKLKYEILRHPKSSEDVSHDKDLERQKIILSKIQAYPCLKDPPLPDKDTNIITFFGDIKQWNKHDAIDIHILYAVYKNAVSYLITEDQGIHKKAEKLKIKECILDITEAIDLFKKKLVKDDLNTQPAAIKKVPMHSINIDTPFFKQLFEDYGNEEFKQWWIDKCKEGRDALVYFTAEDIGALLILKDEEESISEAIPPLPKRRRLKICTFKVSYKGYKIGELFLKMAIEFAINNGIEEIYLTHFIKDPDELVKRIEPFGFRIVAKKIIKDEPIFLKRLLPEGNTESIEDIRRLFYPSIYDGDKCNKHLVPIQPEYFDKLFPDFPKEKEQTKLSDFTGEIMAEGITIKKAYICHANTHKILPGDIIWIYIAHDQIIASIGVVEEVHNDLTDAEQIKRLVAKRTVYSDAEIENEAKTPTKVILFRWHFHLKNPVSYSELLKSGIINGPIQSIRQISQKGHNQLKQIAQLDPKFMISDI